MMLIDQMGSQVTRSRTSALIASEISCGSRLCMHVHTFMYRTCRLQPAGIFLNFFGDAVGWEPSVCPFTGELKRLSGSNESLNRLVGSNGGLQSFPNSLFCIGFLCWKSS